MKEQQAKQTEAQIKLAELLSQRFLTAYGKYTIPQLTSKFGAPKAILKYAKVEAKTGLVGKPTMIVDRFVDGELFFQKDVVVSGISKDKLLQMDYDGIETVYVRHPTYNPANMVKATDKEINDLVLKSHQK